MGMHAPLPHLSFVIDLTHTYLLQQNYIKMCVRDRRCPNIFEELVEAFSLLETFVGDPPEEVPGSNIRSRVTSFDGIRVRVYEPIKKDGEGDLPAFLYCHGGGLAVGDIGKNSC